jgi:predicted XRE-type DNA-binding protein
MKPKMKRESFANVWDAIEDDRTVAANMTMRSDLLIALQQRVASWKVAQAQAARRLEITQPRLNDLLRNRINKFSLDMLVNLANRADIRVSLKISKAAWARQARHEACAAETATAIGARDYGAEEFVRLAGALSMPAGASDLVLAPRREALGGERSPIRCAVGDDDIAVAMTVSLSVARDPG